MARRFFPKAVILAQEQPTRERPRMVLSAQLRRIELPGLLLVERLLSRELLVPVKPSLRVSLVLQTEVDLIAR